MTWESSEVMKYAEVLISSITMRELSLHVNANKFQLLEA